MIKLTHQWEQTTMFSKLHLECSGVEGETQRAVVQRKQSLTLRQQRRYITGIEEGKQRKPVPTGYTSMHLCQR